MRGDEWALLTANPEVIFYVLVILAGMVALARELYIDGAFAEMRAWVRGWFQDEPVMPPAITKMESSRWPIPPGPHGFRDLTEFEKRRRLHSAASLGQPVDQDRPRGAA